MSSWRQIFKTIQPSRNKWTSFLWSYAMDLQGLVDLEILEYVNSFQKAWNEFSKSMYAW
jgi:hypothetical protein